MGNGRALSTLERGIGVLILGATGAIAASLFAQCQQVQTSAVKIEMAQKSIERIEREQSDGFREFRSQIDKLREDLVALIREPKRRDP